MPLSWNLSSMGRRRRGRRAPAAAAIRLRARPPAGPHRDIDAHGIEELERRLVIHPLEAELSGNASAVGLDLEDSHLGRIERVERAPLDRESKEGEAGRSFSFWYSYQTSTRIHTVFVG